MAQRTITLNDRQATLAGGVEVMVVLQEEIHVDVFTIGFRDDLGVLTHQTEFYYGNGNRILDFCARLSKVS